MIKLILAILFWCSTVLWSQQAYDARAAAMGFSSGADSRGLQHIGLNPATLSLPTDYSFEFNLFSVNATANNNSFKKSQYDRFFTTGDLLSSQDIEEILNSVPDHGFRADGFARVNTLAFYVPHFSLALTGSGVGVANVPKDALELPLNGNSSPGRVYNLDDTDGSDWVGLSVVAGFSAPLWKDAQKPGKMFAAGISLKYISGIHFDEVMSARGELRDFSLADRDPYIDINGRLEVLSSGGGQGWGADFGLLYSFDERGAVGLTLLNALSRVRWDQEPELRVLAIEGENLALPGRVSDSLIVHTDRKEAIDPFTTHLPAIVDLALAYHWSPDFLTTAEYEQGLSHNMGGTRRARVGMGIEYRGIPVVPLRAGVTFGAKTGSSFTVGLGIDLKYWYLDVAYLNHGRVVPGDFKGIGLAVSSRLRF